MDGLHTYIEAATMFGGFAIFLLNLLINNKVSGIEKKIDIHTGTDDVKHEDFERRLNELEYRRRHG